MNLLKSLFKKDKIRLIYIGDNFIHEFKDVEEYNEFLKVGNKFFPKPKKFYYKNSIKYYIINEEKIQGVDKEKIEKLFEKKEEENIYNALINVATRTKEDIVKILIMGLLGGIVLKNYLDRFFDWLYTLPPETISQFSNFATILSVLGIILFFFYRMRNRQ